MTRLVVALSPIIALAALGAGPAPDSFSADDLSRLESERAEAESKLNAIQSAAESAEQDLASINAQLIAAAQESRRREEQAAIIERRLIDLKLRESLVRANLLSDEEGLEDLMAALAIASSSRPPALVAQPEKASDAVRAAILMSSAAPALRNRANALGGELRQLSELTNEIREQQRDLAAAEAVLMAKRQEIEILAAKKRAQFEDITGQADGLRQRVSSLSSELDTLKSLLAELERNAPSAPGRKPRLGPGRSDGARDLQVAYSDTLGTGEPLERLLAPASGPLDLGYGDKTIAGTVSQGLVFDTRTAAQVVAPADGRIEYADAFRSYGQMLILRTSDGYHIILSGLDALYGTPGQWVLSGEPIGRMSERQTPPPQLYMELRKDGVPMDPSKFMKRSVG